MVLRNLLRALIYAIPEGQSWRLEKWIKEPQPSRPDARVVLTVLTNAGPDANGKVSSYDFLPSFCDTLRRNNLATTWVSSTRELSRVFKSDVPVILIHLFGEDRVQIASPEVLDFEKRALATFNSAETGLLLADKLASHKAFAAAGVPVPALKTSGGFVRERFGTGMPSSIEDEQNRSDAEDVSRIRTEYVDTRIAFRGKSYHATVRLLCLDGVILHAFVRARNTEEGNANVHSRNTPVDPDLIEFLQETLVKPRTAIFADIAQRMYQVLGHGFYAHDLLIESKTGATFVCEGGFKFNDGTYAAHLDVVSADLPSHDILFSTRKFAIHSAEVFAGRCQSILGKAPS